MNPGKWRVLILRNRDNVTKGLSIKKSGILYRILCWSIIITFAWQQVALGAELPMPGSGSKDCFDERGSSIEDYQNGLCSNQLFITNRNASEKNRGKFLGIKKRTEEEPAPNEPIDGPGLPPQDEPIDDPIDGPGLPPQDEPLDDPINGPGLPPLDQPIDGPGLPPQDEPIDGPIDDPVNDYYPVDISQYEGDEIIVRIGIGDNQGNLGYIEYKYDSDHNLISETPCTPIEGYIPMVDVVMVRNDQYDDAGRKIGCLIDIYDLQGNYINSIGSRIQGGGPYDGVNIPDVTLPDEPRDEGFTHETDVTIIEPNYGEVEVTPGPVFIIIEPSEPAVDTEITDIEYGPSVETEITDIEYGPSVETEITDIEYGPHYIVYEEPDVETEITDITYEEPGVVTEVTDIVYDEPGVVQEITDIVYDDPAVVTEITDAVYEY
ncbi:MAG: hypothetical protein ABIG92_06375 [Candidatus Omnitrophota bacterium]